MAKELDLAVRLRLIDNNIKASIDRVKASISSLKGGQNLDFSKSEKSVKSLNAEIQKTPDLLRRAFQLGSVLFAAKQVLNFAENYKSLNARLRLAADSQADFNQSQEDTIRVSKETGTQLKANVELYQKFRTNVGLSADQSLRLTGTLAKASQLDGGGASAQAAITQFGQAANSGRLAGEELRSIREQLPTLAETIRKGMGLSRLEFGRIAKDGGFAFEEVVKAVDKMQKDVDAKFNELPKSSKRSFENLITSATVSIGKIDEQFQISSKFAGFLDALGNNTKTLIGLTVSASVAVTGLWLKSISTRRAAENAAHVARLAEIVVERQAALAAAIASVPKRSLGTGARAVGETAEVVAARAGVNSASAALAGASTSGGLFASVIARIVSVLRFLTGPIGIAITLLSALVGFFATNSDKVVEFEGKTVSLGNIVSATWAIIKDTIVGAFQAIGQALGISGQDVINFIQETKVVVGGIFAGLLASVNFLVTAFIGSFKIIGVTIGATAGFLVTQFTIAVSAVGKLFDGLGKDISNALTGKGLSASNTKSAIASTANAVKDNIKQLTSTIKEEVAKQDKFVAEGGAFGAIARRADQISKANAAKSKPLLDKPKEAAGTATGTTDKSAAGLPKLEAIARDEITLEQAKLDQKKALLQIDFDESIKLAGDNVNAKLRLTTIYYDKLNQLAKEQSELDKKSIESELAAKIKQQEELQNFKPKNRAQADQKDDKLGNLATEIVNLNAKIQAENTKLDTTLAENAAKLKQVSVDIALGQSAAIKGIEEDTRALLEEANSLNLGEAAYREYLIQKQIAIELAKLEKEGIDKTSEAYRKAATEFEAAARAKAGADEGKKAREEQQRQADDIFKNVQQGVQGAFADGLKNIGTEGGGLREIAFNLANTVKNALAEALAGTLANQFLELLGGKDAVVTIAGSLGLGGGAKKGDTVANPIFTKDADKALGNVLDPSAALSEQSGGLLSSITGLFSRVGDLFSGLFSKLTGLLSSIFSGGGSGGGLGGLGGLLGSLGSLFGFASGGYTGDGGKYQPKGIVHGGEFVFTKSSTSKLGVGFLSGLMAFASGGAFASSLPSLSYADGGAVNLPQQAQQTQMPSLNIVNSLAPEVTLDHLNTPAGERTILNIISRNSNSVKQSL